MTLPVFAWEAAFGNDPTDDPYTWTDITADVAENAFTRGKTTDLDRIEAGTGSLALLDDQGYYDQRNASSPYYPNVRPGVPIRQTATLAGVTTPLCTHYVETWPRARKAALITRALTTVDGFTILAAAALAGLTLAQGTTGAQVDAILDYVGWPAGKRIVSTGSATVVGQVFSDTDTTTALPYLQEITSNEAGLLFMDGDGNVVFLDRGDLLGPPFNEIQATFTDDPTDAGAYVYDDSVPNYGNERIFNDWTGTRPGGGDPQRVYDPTSITRYGSRPKQIQTLLTNDADVLAAMQHYLGYYMEPRERLQSITVRPGEDSAYWALMLALDLGDRVSVTETMPYGLKRTDDYLIEKKTLTRAPGSDAGAVFDLALWPTETPGTPSGLVFDDAALGLVGTGTMGW